MAESIRHNGGLITQGGRQWFEGDTLSDDQCTEFDEDHIFPLCDLSESSPRSDDDFKYTYNFEDIDTISRQLGIPWEASKDIPFSSSVVYLGLTWDLNYRTVTLSDPKHIKYLLAINEWNLSRTHTLHEVQKLHGRLLHATLVIPPGRAYLIHLEAMLAIFGDSPFKPRTPPLGTVEDLLWWSTILNNPPRPLTIPRPGIIYDFIAFSDTSSGFGIGITVDKQWQAWRLCTGWNTDGRDIGWAESIGFELLVRHIISSGASNICFKLFGDNRGVVEGWWNGRSRNKPTNDTFKRIHSILDRAECTVITRYVPSSGNPADGPSRGIYPPLCLCLPAVPIPHALWPFIEDISDEDCATPHQQSFHHPSSTNSTRAKPSKQQRLA